jgi:hypothetical protein
VVTRTAASPRIALTGPGSYPHMPKSWCIKAEAQKRESYRVLSLMFRVPN